MAVVYTVILSISKTSKIMTFLNRVYFAGE